MAASEASTAVKINPSVRKTETSNTSSIIIHLNLRTVKLTFLALCCFLCAIVFIVFTFSSPGSRNLLPVFSCKNGGYLPWMCDTALRFKPQLETSGRERASIPMYSKRECPGLTVSFPLEETQTFQLVDGSNIYVYSAFHDRNSIRIIGIRERNDNSTFYCQIWTDTVDEDPLFIEKAIISDLPENHKRQYWPIYMVCPLARKFKMYPRLAVSVSRKRCGDATLVLPVINSGPMTSEFIVCVPPLKYNYSEAHTLIESIELKRLLGARKLIFYNHSIDETVSKVLHNYENHGIVDVHQWKLPMEIRGFPPQVHTAAQIAANNDCLYRYRLSTHYMVVQDVDEFIIPRDKNMYNWTHLVARRLAQTPDASSFQVRNVFFRKEWVSLAKNFVANADVLRYKSMVLQHVTKEDHVFTAKVRSKYICDTTKVHTVGIHFVWEKLSGVVDRVPPPDALLHHYRKFHYKNTKEKMQSKVRDTSVVDKYGMALLRNVKKAWMRLEKDAGLKFDKVNCSCEFIIC